MKNIIMLNFHVFMLLFSTTLLSCNGDIITEYTFGKTELTRVDNDGITTFYFGIHRGVERSCNTYVNVEYFGRNNCMDAYLVFKKDQTVEIVPNGCGYFQKTGECKINIGEYRNDSLDFILKSFRNSGYGVMRIYNHLDIEKSFSENKASKVTSHYY